LIMPRASLADLDKAGFGDFDHFPASGTAGQARIVFYGPKLPKTVVRTFLAAVLAMRRGRTEGRTDGRTTPLLYIGIIKHWALGNQETQDKK
jgi:hypothetical protein